MKALLAAIALACGLLASGSSIAAVPNYQGLWWNAQESGWGINFAHQGDVIFATWFTYGADNQPQWYTIVAQRTGTGVYAGPVSSFTGPPFSSVPFPANANVKTPVGTATITFAADGRSATFAYTVNGIAQTKQIVPQEFSSPVPTCVWGAQPDLTLATNYQDLWWVTNGDESGWGINLIHQGPTIFASWFTYDANGKAWWLFVVATQTAVPKVYSGLVKTATGPSFDAEPFDPNAVVRTTVGTATLTFADGNSAALAYTVNGVSQSKEIKRQVFVSPGTVCGPPPSDADVEADIVRLLEQSTMGPTEALIAEVKQKGMVPWLDEQLELYESRYTAWPPYFGKTMVERVQCIQDPVCINNTLSPGPVAWEFYRQALVGRDQVRQRFAYALHQLFVLGIGGPSETYAIGNHQQRVRDFAFSTYEEALYQYSISPQLGYFQGWANNVPEHDGIKPNENYAREILQLLTTGVNRLNEDGTEQVDGEGNPVPAYEQADVTALSRVFTGFTYRLIPGMPGPQYFPVNADLHLGTMVPFDQFHDQGAKSLFGGTVQLPAGQGADADVRAAIHAIVGHTNTPPFICRQLIQRLVTSAPSPAYVARVVKVFKDNGRGVRGDLKAVLRAILLDPEARGARKTDPRYGRMREPALFFTSIMRALDIPTDGYLPALMGIDVNMVLFQPSTIFSYFPADFSINNGELPAAEFGIYGTSAYVTRTNLVNRFLFFRFGTGPEALPQPFVPNATGTPFPTMAAFLASTADPAAYVERLNRLFFHGAMSDATRQTMTNAVAAIPASDALTRAKIGAYLSLTSLDYLIQK